MAPSIVFLRGLVATFPLLMFWPQFGPAQPPAAQRFWVFWPPRTCLHQPALGPQCLQQRQQAGIDLDEADYPVDAENPAWLCQMGLEPGVNSRWLNATSVCLLPHQQQQLLASGRVRAVVPLHTGPMRPAHQTVALPPLPEANSWAHRLMGLPELWEKGLLGSGVRMAVFDDGFPGADSLPAFERLRQNLEHQQDFVKPGQTAFRQGGHGTRVLSILAAQTSAFTGAAPGCTYSLLRTENHETETRAEEDYWVAAAEWADSVGIRLFQTSLGYNEYDYGIGSYDYASLNGQTAPMTIAAATAARKGILVVNSAGNEGSGSWKYIVVPADAPGIVAVGAVDGRVQPASFSSMGPTADGRIKPDLAAPGQGIQYCEANGSLRRGNGTSYAAPLVSALAACLWQAVPQATAGQLRQALLLGSHLQAAPNNRLGAGVPFGPLCLHLLHRLVGPDTLPITLFVLPSAPQSGVLVASPGSLAQGDVLLLRDARGRKLAASVLKPQQLQPLEGNLLRVDVAWPQGKTPAVATLQPATQREALPVRIYRSVLPPAVESQSQPNAPRRNRARTRQP